jgi:S1-C subfamily serine protease
LYSKRKQDQLGDSSKLVLGQEVLTIGNPLGITETATQGIVSALNRSVTESTGTAISHAIQTDAALNPGNSGGALINLQGQLIGIPTLTAVNTESNTVANGVSFAIPSNLVKTVVQCSGRP